MAKKVNRPKGEKNKSDKLDVEDTPKSNKKKVFSGINSDKIRIGFGLTLILISLIFLIAFTSFLITGNYDQNILQTNLDELGSGEVRNWLGKFGAVLSQKFMGDWFGISAFIFVPILFRLGIKSLFKLTLVPTKVVFKYSIFILLWLPAFMAFFFTSSDTLMLSGGIGWAIINTLNLALGSIGSLLILLFVLAAFILINFNISLENLFPKTDVLMDKKTDNHEAEVGEETSPELDFKLEKRTEKVVEEESIIATPLPVSEPVAPIAPVDELPLDVVVPPESIPVSSTPLEDAELPIENISLDTTVIDTKPTIVDEDIEIEAVVGEGEETLKDSEIRDLAKEFGEYDPELDLSKYQKPSLDLLKDFGETGIQIDRTELEENKNRIIVTLKNYKIEISSISAVIGPTVTLYEIVPAAGVRISKIKNLEDDIALSLSALGIRIIAPIPGRGTIGIEVPNKNSEIVSMKTMLASDKFQNSKMILPVALGKTISNESYIADLAKMPHLLMAGATGQGKSVGLNAILVSLLYKLHPSQLKFVLVDPKKVELTLYNKIERHYLAKLPDTDEAIITDTQKVVATLNSLCIEMDQRYDLLKEAMARTIVEYNEKFVARKLNPENGHRYLPYIVLVIDEFADLIMTAGKEVETPIARLAQLARAIGIHLIVATQRPSVNVITGMIKANFPARLAFRVTSKIDSRTILDAGGADQLIGRGDLLFSPGNEIVRLQCPFVDTPEVERICNFIGEQQGYADAFLLPEFVGESSTSQGSMADEDRDVLFNDAASIVVQHQQGSASLLQRRLKLGYNRAGRIIDQLEAAGIIGPFSGSKARDVLIPDEMSLAQKLNGDS
tara:strand:- start:15197 stop:17725 length:2529 start_codon:yes stop_codon:yes gene_type:complete